MVGTILSIYALNPNNESLFSLGKGEMPQLRREERNQKIYSGPTNEVPVFSNKKNQIDPVSFSGKEKPLAEPKNNSIVDKVNEFDKKVADSENLYQMALYGLSPIPTIRKLGSMPDTIKNHDYTRAGLLLGFAAISFPRDMEEMKHAGMEILKNPTAGKFLTNIFPALGRLNHSVPSKELQRPLSYFHNTFLSWLPDKFKFLNKIDKTLDSTKFGIAFMKKFKITTPKFETIEPLCAKGVAEQAYNYTDKGFKKIIGRALTRTPVIGIILGGLLELPSIIKSVKQGNTLTEKGMSVGKQLIKSAAYVGLMTAGIAIGGAAAAAIGGTLLSLVGMGVGSTVALLASKQINKVMDKIIPTDFEKKEAVATA